MSLADFVKMMSNPGPTGLGNPDVRTQHLLGAPLYEKHDDGTIDVHWTIRAAHFQQKTGKTMHSHAVTTLQYVKEGGVMKISGVIPNVNWELGPPGEDLSH
jgi:scytalone dehydratase